MIFEDLIGVPYEYLGMADVTKLSENENPFGMSPKAIEAMTAELPNAFMYPEHAFCDLIEALAAANGVPGVDGRRRAWG